MRLTKWAIALGLLVSGQATAWAAPEDLYSSGDGNTQVGNVEPPGPGVAPGPTSTDSGFVAYKPIPDSMLPTLTQGATAVQGQAAPGPTTTTLGGPVVALGPYSFGRDDVVHIAVRGQPDFSGTFAIGPNGSIQYGYLGDIPAEGMTKEQLRDVLIEKLKQYVRVPSVQVTIVGFNSKAVYILGRVARPGKYAMRGDSIKIRDALIAAGLVTAHAALKRVLVIKSDPKDPSREEYNLKAVLYKGKMKDNVDLVAGDIVVVPSTVWGNVSDFITNLTDPAGKAGTVAGLAAF